MFDSDGLNRIIDDSNGNAVIWLAHSASGGNITFASFGQFSIVDQPNECWYQPNECWYQPPCRRAKSGYNWIVLQTDVSQLMLQELIAYRETWEDWGRPLSERERELN